ncbi:MAG: MFS transporter [Negativicutes bacterium]|nr:MFS transporter [Negativicutes bacterium]
METRTFDENKLMSKVRWKIVPYIMFLYVIAMVDRVNIGFAALQMNKDLGISATAFGMLAGIFFIAYFFFEVPSNVIMHKVGARIWVARILITWGLVTVATGFVHSITQMGIMRFLLGAAEAGFHPCMILYLTFWFPAKHLAKAVSFYICGMAIANILVGPVSAWIMDNANWYGLVGWRWMFILEGIPAVIMGLVTLFVMIDRPEQAKFLTPEEKAWLVAELKKEHEIKAAKLKVSKWAVFGNFRVWHISWVHICMVLAMYGLGMWMPQILRALSKMMTNTQIGLVSTLPYICGVIAMVLIARHSDKTGERRWHVATPIFVSFIGLLALTMTSNLPLSVFFLCITMAGFYGFIGTFWTLPHMFLSEGAAAVGIAIISSVGNLGGFFGPYFVGFLKDLTGSTDAGIYVLASFALLCTLSVLAFPKNADPQAAQKNATA